MNGLQWTEIYFSQFWMLRSQDQGHGQFSVWWEPVSWFIDNHFSSFILTWQKGREYSVPWLWFNYLKVSPPNNITLTNNIWLGCKSDVYISSLILPLWICIHLCSDFFVVLNRSIHLFNLYLACSSWTLPSRNSSASIASIPIRCSLSVENRKEPFGTNHPNSCTKRPDQTLA